MRITLFLLFFCILFSSASNSYSQKFTIKSGTTSIKEVCEEIEKNSDYIFVFSDNSERALRKKVNVNANSENVENVLDEIFADTGLTYSIIDKQIVVYESKDDIPIKKVERIETIALQQQTGKQVSGTVTDHNGVPLPGVTVVIKGTTQGTVTNADGNYSLYNISEDVILVFSFVGMRSQEVVVGNQTSINVKMQEEAIGLDEVVAVGYGIQKKESVTGAISTISSDKLTKAPYASTSNTLVGRIPGLITKQNSGLPGSDGSSFSIRSFGSPLIIVDGIESNFNNIDANEIESISVLKDTSAAIYGSRAGNGVILVTTKRGNISKPTITFNFTHTLQGTINLMKMTNAGQYTEMIREEHLQQGRPEETSRFSAEDVMKYKEGTDPDYPSTDWFNYLIHDFSPQQQYNLSLRGGTDRIKYYGFFGYLNQESMIKRNGGNYNRYNLRSNIDATILRNLSMSVDFSSIFEFRRFPWRGDEGDDSIWQDLWGTEPIYPSTLPDPSKIPFANGGGTGGAHITSNRKLSGARDSDNLSFKLSSSLKYDITAIKGLSSKFVFTYDGTYGSNKTFVTVPDTWTYHHSSDTYTKQAAGINTELGHSENRGRVLTGNLSLCYDRTFLNKHQITALALYELIDYGNTWLSGSRTGYETTAIRYLFAGGLANQFITGSASEMGRSSYVGRLNYAYREKYLLETTIRFDGSAKFASEYRWGTFPSVSLGWRISEEPFIKEHVEVIDNLKIRTGYSITGNDAVANFNYLAGYRQGNTYNIGGKTSTGITATGIANPLLSWEDMHIVNLGMDLGMFKNRFVMEVDVFNRERKGIPGTRANSLPSTFGATLPVENLNSTTTKGFEFLVGHQNRNGNFYHNVSANISWSRSKWSFFDEPEYEDPDEIRLYKKTGAWTDRYLGYRSDGLFTSQDEIDALNYHYDQTVGNKSLREGDLKLLNLNDDELLNWRDQDEIGKGAMPHWMVGLNIDLEFRGFDFSSLLQGGMGFSHYVTLRHMAVFPLVMYNERWTYENNNPNAIVPRLGGASSNSFTSDYYLKRGDYLRLKSLSLGYTIPNHIINNFKLEKMRIYLAGTNLFTLSELNKYSIDPEAPSGRGGYYYPQMRTFTLGISISL